MNENAQKRTTIHRGDLLRYLRGHEWLAQNGYIPKAHAVLCDPPYGLAFMNSAWDDMGPHEYQAWCTEWGRLMLSYVYPGAVLAAFGGTRTYHRLAAGLEDAGWIVGDSIMWVYSSGFPKSHNIGKAIDREAPRVGMFDKFAQHFKEQREKKGLSQREIAVKFPSKTGGLTGCVWNWENAANVPTKEQWGILQPLLDLSVEYLPLIERVETEREILGQDRNWGKAGTVPMSGYGEWDITAPATDAARHWESHGTAMAPAYEPIVVCRAPWSGTYAGIAQQYGTGAINIEGSRIGVGEPIPTFHATSAHRFEDYSVTVKRTGETRSNGRWPKNLILGCACESDDHSPGCPVRIMGEQTSERTSKPSGTGVLSGGVNSVYNGGWGKVPTNNDDSGGDASRFFYTAKAAQWERSAGLHHRAAQTVNDGRDTPIDNPYQRGETERLNIHPTCKPVKLVEYLARLLLPPELDTPRRILVPFSGSGSEMIGARLAGWEDIIGFEQSDEYADIAEARLAWWSQFADYDMAKRAYDADRGEAQQRANEAATGMRQQPLWGAP